MLFKYLATEVRSYEAVVEVLSQVPAAWNGLMPFGFALFHDSNSVKGYILDFFDSLQQYPVCLLTPSSSSRRATEPTS